MNIYSDILDAKFKNQLMIRFYNWHVRFIQKIY